MNDGIAGRLGGEDDDKLSSDVLPFWDRMGMSAKRARIGEEIRQVVASGKITEFKHYAVLLKPYPNSRFCQEGHEAFRWIAGNGGDSDGTSDNDDGDSKSGASATDNELLQDLDEALFEDGEDPCPSDP